MIINLSADHGACVNPATPRKPLAILVRASVPPGSLPSSEEIVAKAPSLGATLAFPEDSDLLEDPGVAPRTFVGQQARLEDMSKNAGSESGRRHGLHLHAQRAAYRMGAGRPGSAAGNVHKVFWQDTDRYACRIGRLNGQEAVLPHLLRNARAAMAVCA